MRKWIAALLFLPAASDMAAAMDAVRATGDAPQTIQQMAAAPPDTSPGTPGSSNIVENAVEEIVWEAEPNPTPEQKRFSRMQSDELAARLGFKNGKADWARFDLKDSDGNGPAIAGTFDGGAAKMVLRWRHD